MSEQPYTAQFFQAIREGARRSAREIVPFVLEISRPRNVVDIGCGDGVWLSVFREHGIDDVWGLDGDYVDKSALQIPEERFVATDLRRGFPGSSYFDLVVSLEVAEHLPRECAETFVETLTRHAPFILFSAAIPYQGGVNHINEQWQDYWANLFAARDYLPVDCIRKKVWQNPNVDWWYAQNTFLYVKRDSLNGRAAHSLLLREFANTDVSQLRLVHPRQYLYMAGAYGRIEALIKRAAPLIPPRETLILIDHEWWANESVADRYVLSFLERDGQLWRRPQDNDPAVQELERLRGVGAGFVIFGHPIKAWFHVYAGLQDYLRTAFRPVLEDEFALVFDLRTSRAS